MMDTSQQWMTLLAQQVRQRRLLLKMSQREVARLADCHYVFVHDLEKGKPTLRFDKVLDVLRVLGLELEVKSER